MALPVVVPNAVRVTLYFNFNGELAVNVYGARIISGLIDQARAEAVGGAIKAAFTAQAATFATTTSLLKVGLRDIRSANMPEFRDSGAATVGTSPGDALPRNVAAVVTLRTALSGKRYRGRSYIGGFTENENTASGQISAALQASLVSWVSGVSGAMQANQLQMGVVSVPAERKVVTETVHHADGTTSVETVSDTPARAGLITDVNVIESRNTLWESQRRRGNGRGGPIATVLGGTRIILPAPPPA